MESAAALALLRTYIDRDLSEERQTSDHIVMPHTGADPRLLAREIWALLRLLRGTKQVEQSAA